MFFSFSCQQEKTVSRVQKRFHDIGSDFHSRDPESVLKAVMSCVLKGQHLSVQSYLEPHFKTSNDRSNHPILGDLKKLAHTIDLMHEVSGINEPNGLSQWIMGQIDPYNYNYGFQVRLP